MAVLVIRHDSEEIVQNAHRQENISGVCQPGVIPPSSRVLDLAETDAVEAGMGCPAIRPESRFEAPDKNNTLALVSP